MRRLADERGIALVMALGILIVLSITTASLLTYTGSNARTARYQNARVTAYSVAEAGVNEAVAVLNLPTNNAMNPDVLPKNGAPDPSMPVPCNSTQTFTSTYDGGAAKWTGQLDPVNAWWTICSKGTVNNPSGASAVARTLKVHVPIRPALSQNPNNQAWNYIYSYKPDDDPTDDHLGTCEMTITNSVQVSTPLFVEGDLCIDQTAGIRQGSHGTALVVKGQLTLANSNQNSVGINSSDGRISEAYIGTGCKLQNNPVNPSPCSGADNVFATKYDTVQPDLGPRPVAKWSDWYNAAAPGPKFPCVPERSSPSNTWPTFESTGNTALDNSVTPAVNLTPLTGYDCWTDGGELAWNPTSRVLTVNGTVFIDGSAYIQNDVKPAVYTYTGMGTIYLSGTFLLKNAKLCAVVLGDGSGCDTDPTHWNPNQRVLIIATKHFGDNGLPNTDGIQLVSAYFQGGVYAEYDIDIDTSSNIDGPIIGSVVKLGQSVNTSFPFITFVPNGAPGGQTVYAQPQPPTDYDG